MAAGVSIKAIIAGLLTQFGPMLLALLPALLQKLIDALKEDPTPAPAPSPGPTA